MTKNLWAFKHLLLGLPDGREFFVLRIAWCVLRKMMSEQEAAKARYI
jgi:hypothetical protein